MDFIGNYFTYIFVYNNLQLTVRFPPLYNIHQLKN